MIAFFLGLSRYEARFYSTIFVKFVKHALQQENLKEFT